METGRTSSAGANSADGMRGPTPPASDLSVAGLHGSIIGTTESFSEVGASLNALGEIDLSGELADYVNLPSDEELRNALFPGSGFPGPDDSCEYHET